MSGVIASALSTRLPLRRLRFRRPLLRFAKATVLRWKVDERCWNHRKNGLFKAKSAQIWQF